MGTARTAVNQGGGKVLQFQFELVRCVIGSHAGYKPPPLLRLVLMLGTYYLPSCDWFSRWVYTISPPAIGSRVGYILPPLLRFVLALGIYYLPSCDWFSRSGEGVV
eukprot:946504-Pyramimonas_sp.AAC.1